MLLGKRNQVKNLPLKTNPSLNVSDAQVPWMGFVVLVGEKPHCKLAPMTVLLSFIEKLLLEPVAFLTFVAMA